MRAERAAFAGPRPVLSTARDGPTHT